AMVDHPGIALVAMDTLIPIGPNALRQGEGMLAIVRAGGLSVRDAAYALDALSTYCKAYALEVTRWPAGDYDPDEIAKRGRQVAARVRTSQPKRAGVRTEEALVPVGRAEAGEHEGATRNFLVPHGMRLDGDPPGLLHRAVVTQELLDRVGLQIRPLPQQRQLV